MERNESRFSTNNCCRIAANNMTQVSVFSANVMQSATHKTRKIANVGAGHHADGTSSRNVKLGTSS